VVCVIFSRALMMAGLTALGWLLLFTGALMLLLTLVQYVRGDIDARPLVTLAGGILFAALGYGCRLVARRVMGVAE
jgi:hypothetical protein